LNDFLAALQPGFDQSQNLRPSDGSPDPRPRPTPGVSSPAAAALDDIPWQQHRHGVGEILVAT
jgi:hypothetical protein